jgi:hypothetical protein
MRFAYVQLHRDLFTEPEIAALRDACVPLYEHYAVDNTLPMGRVFAHRHEDKDGLARLERLLLWFWNTPLPGIFQAMHGTAPALQLDFLSVRRHDPGNRESHVAWHADANFTAGPGAGPLMTCWVPLNPVGEDAPGLDFCVPLRKPSGAVLHERWLQVMKRSADGSFTDEGLDEIYGTGNYRIESHRLDPGDCHVFDRYMIHRTQRLETVTRARYAVEFRVVSRSVPARSVSANPGAALCVQDPETGGLTILTAQQLYGSP